MQSSDQGKILPIRVPIKIFICSTGIMSMAIRSRDTTTLSHDHIIELILHSIDIRGA